MKFLLEIDMDNAAFGDDEPTVAGYELFRILGKVRSAVLDGCTEGACLDINGNTVGQWRIELPFEPPTV